MRPAAIATARRMRWQPQVWLDKAGKGLKACENDANVAAAMKALE
jgi:hypothetical protein